ncbi:MAG: ComF family protein [Salinivirgaceae bacterium]|nr:ComF family protein [Salinivirgaceae bacterium]
MGWLKTIQLLGTDLLSLFTPPKCCACGNALVRGENMLCTHCIMKMPKTNFHKVRGNMVEKSFWGRVPIEYATSYFFFLKSSDFQHLLHALKYNGRSDIGIYLGKHFGHELIRQPEFCHFDSIIPVPLHPDKLRKRGYNQSEMFARGLSKSMNIPVETKVLERTTFTETQTHKSRIERWENVKSVFAANPNINLNGKHILLVDDVLTTGATIEGCANALLEKNPMLKISVATLAYAHTV